MNNDCIMIKCPLPNELGKVRDRLTLVEKCVQELIDERDKSVQDFKTEKQELHWQQKYVELKKNFVHLKEVNAELRNKSVCCEGCCSNVDCDDVCKEYRNIFAENKKLQAENAQLKEVLAKRKCWIDYENHVAVTDDLHRNISNLQSELESLKKNQLSKDEILDITVCLRDILTQNSVYGLLPYVCKRLPSLIVKLESMVGENK